MRARTLALLAAAAFASSSQAGEILRCTGNNGETIYTNRGCPADTQAHHVSNYEPVPDAPPSPANLAAEEAALSASRAEQAAERAEAAAYNQQAAYYETPQDERGGPYHQHEDNNVYYPAWFGGGYPLLGAGNGGRHAAHHGTFARSGGGSRHEPARGAHPQPLRFAGGRQR